MSIYPPTGTLEIKNATLKIPVIDLQYTSNTAKIEANSNVVTEFPRSKKLIKYPRVALTQNDESGTSGYVVDQTNTASHGNADAYAYRLFDNTSGAYQSGSAYSGGNPTSSAPTTTASDGSTHQGVAITLDLVTKIRLDHVIFTSHANYGRTPVDGSFLGSNDSSTWDVIGTFTGLSTSADNQKHTITITGSSQKLAYRYIRFVVTKTHNSSVFNGNSLLEFRELEYYGVPEYDSEAHGVDVTVKSVPNVPNTDWLEVYYDGQDYSTMPATVTDKSGNNRTGTPSGGVGFDSTYKAFTFDGSNDYISSPTTATLSNHTASMWIKFDSPAAWEAVYSIKPASGFDRNNFILYVNSTFFRLESSGNTGPYYDINYTFVPGTWVHLTLVFRGTGLEDCELYIDNVRLVPSGGKRSETDDITITGTNTIYVGSDPAGYYLDGSIANFRLFNRALTSDEIYQLYAYQKEYFRHGDLSMTLKAGRLGIGTSEPRAALDVRGNIIGGCPAAFSVAYNPTSLSGNQTIIWNLIYHNVGGGYNSSNGLFTAPVSGYYHFTVWGMTSGTASGTIEFQFMKNGSTVQQRPYGHAGGNYGNATGSIIEYLNIGDTMSIFLTNGTTMYATSTQSYNGFSGFYLSS
jgi:hypothetical protein